MSNNLKIYSLRHTTLVLLEHNGTTKCYTCGKPLEINDTVVTKRHHHTTAIRCIDCATRVGII
jgi:DNA-directed RNA polymerase subunit RPC12/RpoP